MNDSHALRFVRALIVTATVGSAGCGTTSGGTCNGQQTGNSCTVPDECTTACSPGSGGGGCHCVVPDGGGQATWLCGLCTGPLDPPESAA